MFGFNANVFLIGTLAFVRTRSFINNLQSTTLISTHDFTFRFASQSWAAAFIFFISDVLMTSTRRSLNGGTRTRDALVLSDAADTSAFISHDSLQTANGSLLAFTALSSFRSFAVFFFLSFSGWYARNLLVSWATLTGSSFDGFPEFAFISFTGFLAFFFFRHTNALFGFVSDTGVFETGLGGFFPGGAESNW